MARVFVAIAERQLPTDDTDDLSGYLTFKNNARKNL